MFPVPADIPPYFTLNADGEHKGGEDAPEDRVTSENSTPDRRQASRSGTRRVCTELVNQESGEISCQLTRLGELTRTHPCRSFLVDSLTQFGEQV
jgi:hypothetical protein